MVFEGDDLFAEKPTEGGASASKPVPPEATLIQGAADLGPEINGVKVESTIGTGGQGTVFLGRQEYLNRRVAVKVLHKATNPKLADRFRREATILAGLHHPNIVSCYSAGVSSSEECFMVMEYIDGPDLHDHVKENGPVGLGLALDLMSDLADALAHGLEASVIHRDIKPQNVLLKSGSTQTGRGVQAKLTDLGLARFTDDKGEGFETTEQGAVLGTPTTMAPEQSDDPDSVDHRTDIYGLGCVFYWALTGKRAFFAKSMAALYRMKTSGEGLKKIEQDPDLPAQVKPLLVAMLAAEPGDRPQTYEELVKALADLKSGVAPESRDEAAG
ncbi:serine/threonine protein kinase [bacterium]|nr:serine/threonine protein kinase [bacterium]